MGPAAACYGHGQTARHGYEDARQQAVGEHLTPSCLRGLNQSKVLTNIELHPEEQEDLSAAIALYSCVRTIAQ